MVYVTLRLVGAAALSYVSRHARALPRDIMPAGIIDAREMIRIGRDFFRSPPAIPVPSACALQFLELRFRAWTRHHDRDYRPGTREYRRRYLNWLLGYKQYYRRVQSDIGSPPPVEWLNWYTGTEHADYDDDELLELQAKIEASSTTEVPTTEA